MKQSYWILVNYLLGFDLPRLPMQWSLHQNGCDDLVKLLASLR